MKRRFRNFDWILFLSILPLIFFGLLTMKSIGESGTDYYFSKQLILIGIGALVFFVFSMIDWHIFESNTTFLMLSYVFGVGLLLALFIAGTAVRGSQSWFHFSFFSLEPSEFMKLILILVLSKYFARRHVEIALSKHLIVSAIYAGIPFMLVVRQPDIGTAFVFAAIWGGMVLFSGVNMKQFIVLALVTIFVVAGSWVFFLNPDQKSRVIYFFSPYADPQGSGYHAIQSTIAVGSGELFGKGVGYGTQSRLRFLPESETDFIFAAFVEEWGLLGAFVVFALFGILFWRLFAIGLRAEGNFPQLVIVGIMALIASHIMIHVGMNTGLFPITGISLPFMSYGGSLFITMMAALGIVESITMKSSFLAYKGAGETVPGLHL